MAVYVQKTDFELIQPLMSNRDIHREKNMNFEEILNTIILSSAHFQPNRVARTWKILQEEFLVFHNLKMAKKSNLSRYSKKQKRDKDRQRESRSQKVRPSNTPDSPGFESVKSDKASQKVRQSTDSKVGTPDQVSLGFGTPKAIESQSVPTKVSQKYS